MKVNECVGCVNFPCIDVVHAGYNVPGVELEPEHFTVALISEAAPADARDYYYAPGEPLFAQTTVLAFQDAGFKLDTIEEILARGVYLTTAVKCAKTGYGIKAATIKECSKILEQELALFPNLKVLLLMGDVAIKSINYIARRNGEARVIPAGATYKIRGGDFSFRNMHVLPSYLQAGPSFFIEKSKRVMIAEDILAGTRFAGICN